MSLSRPAAGPMGDTDRLAEAENMDLRESKGAKLFQDSVHDVMQFHRLIVKFIDTREFQRLRNIKQLSTTYLVYPAAAHNRFEHSLGVCFLAGELLTQLKENSPNLWEWIFSPSTNDGKDEKLIKEKDVKLIVQIAGLLHDLGHGPFSHTWETFVHSCGVKWDHEETSCSLIDIIIWKDDDKKELTEVGKAFQHEFDDVDFHVQCIKDFIRGSRIHDIIKNGSPSEKKRAFLFQVVANKINDVDVDKFDYLLRDAQHLNIGIPFNYRRLIKLCKLEVDADNMISHIAFRDCESYSLQGLFRTRADLHIRAYQHRVSKCLEAMLVDALKSANDEKFKVGGYILSEVQNSPRDFLKLTDSIQEIIHNSVDPSFMNARSIFDRIVERKLYETVGEWVLNNLKQSEEQKKNNWPPTGLTAAKVRELEEKLENKCSVNQVCVNQGKYYEPMKKMRFFSKQGNAILNNSKPSMRMDLPFYKVYVFKRVQDDCDNTTIREKVKEFLIQETVYKEEKTE